MAALTNIEVLKARALQLTESPSKTEGIFDFMWLDVTDDAPEALHAGYKFYLR